MARPFVALLALIAASLIALPATAQWKWRDKGGHVQYSDLPPPAGTADADILTRPNPSMRRSTPTSTAPIAAPASAAVATATASAPRAADPELEAKRKKAEAEVAAKNKAEQDRVVSDEVDANSATDRELRGIALQVGQAVGVGEHATEINACIETFPIEASSVIDRLWGGWDDEISGLSATNEKRGSCHTERK